jgi:hypothetical protein
MGPLLPGGADVSPDTQRLIDVEVRRIVDESHQQVVDLLRQNRSKLDSLATALLEHETLDEEDAYAAAGVPRTVRRPPIRSQRQLDRRSTARHVSVSVGGRLRCRAFRPCPGRPSL